MANQTNQTLLKETWLKQERKNMKLIEILRNLFKNEETEKLKRKVSELEAEIAKTSNDHEFILNNMVVLTKSLTAIKRGQYILNQKADDALNALGSHNEALTAYNHQMQESERIFNALHDRLQAVEGYYFDKPLKQKHTSN